jgi:hypothetical protein
MHKKNLILFVLLTLSLMSFLMFLCKRYQIVVILEV